MVEWRSVVKKTWKSAYSKGYYPNFIVGIITIFFAPLVAIMISTPRNAIWAFAFGLTLIVWFLAYLAVNTLDNQPAPETEFHGYLQPANEAIIESPCKNTPRQAVTVFFGSNAAWIIDKPMVALRVDGVNLLTIKNSLQGLLISAKIFSSDGKIVAELTNNEFTINPNNYFKVNRPDKNTLIVFDQEAKAVLNVRFLNLRNIKIMGTFNSPNQQPIIIDEDKVNRPSQFSGNCWKGNPYIIQIYGDQNTVGGSSLLEENL